MKLAHVVRQVGRDLLNRRSPQVHLDLEIMILSSSSTVNSEAVDRARTEIDAKGFSDKTSSTSVFLSASLSASQHAFRRFEDLCDL